jgi:putative transposase
MTNHVHLVLIPDRADALALAVGQAHLCYARYRNDRYAHKGHLWEGRYFSCPMDEDHCVRAIRYVEQNPVRAGIAVSARAYPWSSAAAHAEGADPHNLLDMDWWKTTGLQSGWARNLDEGSRQPIDEEIRDRTNSGRPLGSDAFVDRLERELGRRLRPGRPGRPRQRP